MVKVNSLCTVNCIMVLADMDCRLLYRGGTTPIHSTLGDLGLLLALLLVLTLLPTISTEGALDLVFSLSFSPHLMAFLVGVSVHVDDITFLS